MQESAFLCEWEEGLAYMHHNIPHLLGGSVSEGAVFLIRVFALLVCINIVSLFFYFGKHLIYPKKNVYATLLEVFQKPGVKMWAFSTLLLLVCYFCVICMVINE